MNDIETFETILQSKTRNFHRPVKSYTVNEMITEPTVALQQNLNLQHFAKPNVMNQPHVSCSP